MLCSQRRNQQGIAQKTAATADRRVANIATREDNGKGSEETTQEKTSKIIRILDPSVFNQMR